MRFKNIFSSLSMPSVALIIIFLFLVSGCSLGTPGPGTMIDNNFRTGKDGIITTFYSDSLNSKIYEDSPFEISFEIANKGAYDAPVGKIVLSGYDENILNFEYTENDGTSLQTIPNINGKSEYSKTGDIDYLVFKSPNGANLEFGDSYSTIITADTCYEYETIATPTVCIVPTPKQLQDSTSCKPATVTMANQGAPIAITKIEEEIMQNAVNFIITVENVGGGDLISPGDENFHACPFHLDETNTNYIEADVKINGLGEPICTPKEKVRLTNGKGRFICRFVTREEGSYNTQLEIKLRYNYHDSISHSIEFAKLQDDYE